MYTERSSVNMCAGAIAGSKASDKHMWTRIVSQLVAVIAKHSIHNSGLRFLADGSDYWTIKLSIRGCWLGDGDC